MDEWFSGLRPWQKVDRLEYLKGENASSGKGVVFVGDGINDAPVLARADVGVALLAVLNSLRATMG